MRGFDFIGLYETWVEEKGWEAIKERLSKTHEWGCRIAERIKWKGRYNNRKKKRMGRVKK